MSRIVPELSEDQLKRLPSPAEALVYRQCRDSLGQGTLVIFSLPWIRVSPHGTPRDGETDFIVFDEARGVLVIEVKGGGVHVDFDSGEWFSVDRQGIKHQIKNPFRQATNEKFALLEYLRATPRWEALGLRPTLGHAVLFPDLDDLSRVVGPDRPPQIMGSRSDVSSLQRWLARVSEFWAGGSPVGVGAAGMTVIADLLCAPREVRPLLSHLIDQEESEHVRLTEEQCRVLRVLGRRNRVVVSGGAGTGKTLLALQKSREFAGGGLETLLVCYNRPLAEHLRHCAADLSALQVMSFHQLCDRFMRSADDKAGTNLLREAEVVNPRADKFDVHFPHALAMATEILPNRFDAIVVDEAQDFGEEYWLPIELLLRDSARSVLFIFCDHNQAIYRRVATFPINDDAFLLTRNCRNTRFIHEAGYAYYQGEPTDPPPIDGAPIQIIDAISRGSQAKRLHSHLLSLLQVERVRPESIAVIVPSRNHKLFYELLKEKPLPKPVRWAIEGYNVSNGIRVDTAQRFKGLEAAIVYLWGADQLDRETDKELLYVTITRAKSRMFLVGELRGCQSVMG